MTVPEFISLAEGLCLVIAAVCGVINIWLCRTIHLLVNSAMTAVKADLALANSRIASLQLIVRTLAPNALQSDGVMTPPPLPPTVASP